MWCFYILEEESEDEGYDTVASLSKSRNRKSLSLVSTIYHLETKDLHGAIIYRKLFKFVGIL